MQLGVFVVEIFELECFEGDVFWYCILGEGLYDMVFGYVVERFVEVVFFVIMDVVYVLVVVGVGFLYVEYGGDVIGFDLLGVEFGVEVCVYELCGGCVEVLCGVDDWESWVGFDGGGGGGYGMFFICGVWWVLSCFVVVV